MTEAIIPLKDGWMSEIPNSYFGFVFTCFNLAQEMELMDAGGICYTNLEIRDNKIRISDTPLFSAVVFMRVGFRADRDTPGLEAVNVWYGVIVKLTYDYIVIEMAESARAACEKSKSYMRRE